ncbi:MAG: hypothetical protein QF561_00280 [Phycisphaerales bacterium]|jgi:hypothetical protein|nr:hypothetical protein [Phycisphaerales bacterium]
MSRSSSGLDRYRRELDPALVARVRSWCDVPGLQPLLESLLSQQRRRRFLDLWVEAMVADQLHSRGCELLAEVETPSGRTCDFRVRLDGLEWFLHVKRLDEGRRGEARHLSISPRLRVLEQIARPFMVRIRWAEGIDEVLMQEFVERASVFLEMAKIGDELTVRDESGLELGAVRVVGQWEGGHISLAIGLPSGFVDETPRIRRLLDRAYRQFMPRAENVILVVGTRRAAILDFDSALLGAAEERWDTHPSGGGRAAVGRARDGFWSGGSRPESTMCAWSHANAASSRLHIEARFREDPRPDPTLAAQVSALFGDDEV